VDLAQYRHDSLESWDRFASNWDGEREYLWQRTRPVSERLVERLDPSLRDTVLELAAGTGETGFLIGARVGDEGRVISTDFAPTMVEVARRRRRELGFENFEHRVLDGERMDLDDASVDGVACRFGYMLMADPAAALAETRRVLRAGGRLSFAVWSGPDQNLWAAIPGMVLIERGHMPPPEPGAPGIFGMADPDRIRELVTGAGFGEPSIEQVAVEWRYADSAEHWQKTMSLAAPIAEAVAALASDERDRVRAAVGERIEELLGDDGSGADGLTHVVVAE
jgi:ubiquinone/menaquinone biosynthesis C-methylase UbiE